jgi:hypothetical protein
MATFEAQLSAQISQGQKDEIAALLAEDRSNGKTSEADIVRAALREGLPRLRRKSSADRLRLYAQINRGE